MLLGISTLMGAIVSGYLTRFFMVDNSVLAIALSFTAGIFLYVDTVDLLPAVSATEERTAILFLFIGFKVITASYTLIKENSLFYTKNGYIT